MEKVVCAIFIFIYLFIYVCVCLFVCLSVCSSIKGSLIEQFFWGEKLPLTKPKETNPLLQPFLDQRLYYCSNLGGFGIFILFYFFKC